MSAKDPRNGKNAKQGASKDFKPDPPPNTKEAPVLPREKKR